MTEIRKDVWNKVALTAFLGHVVLGIWFVERGQLNADEGWYMYAARMISMGQTPYTDFQFFQPPVYPKVMAGLVQAGPGSLLAGRWLSWAMMVLSVGVMALGARRVAGAAGAAVAMVCMGLHPVLLSTSVLAKPYALTLFLVSSGLFLLVGREGRSLRVILGFFLLSLAVGVRISLLALLVPLLIAHWHRHFIFACIGAAMGFFLVLRSIPMSAGTQVWEQVVAFHWGDGGSVVDRVGWLFHVSTVWGIFAMGLFRSEEPIPGLRIACIASVLVHLYPAQLHIEHIVAVVPALTLLLASRVMALIHTIRSRWLSLSLLLLGLATGSRFVHLDEQYSSLQQTMDLGAWLHLKLPQNQQLLTRQVALAVEADRDVVSGCEMGRFGQVEPSVILTSIHNGVGAVALSEGDFEPALMAEIVRLSEDQFLERRVEEPYGQFGDRLWLWAGRTIWAQ